MRARPLQRLIRHQNHLPRLLSGSQAQPNLIVRQQSSFTNTRRLPQVFHISETASPLSCTQVLDLTRLLRWHNHQPMQERLVEQCGIFKITMQMNGSLGRNAFQRNSVHLAKGSCKDHLTAVREHNEAREEYFSVDCAIHLSVKPASLSGAAELAERLK